MFTMYWKELVGQCSALPTIGRTVLPVFFNYSGNSVQSDPVADVTALVIPSFIIGVAGLVLRASWRSYLVSVFLTLVSYPCAVFFYIIAVGKMDETEHFTVQDIRLNTIIGVAVAALIGLGPLVVEFLYRRYAKGLRGTQIQSPREPKL